MAIPGNVNFGNGSASINPVINTTQANQFATTTVMSFLNSPGGYTRFQLLGNNQTLAGLSDALGAGMIQLGGYNALTTANVSATLTLDGSGTYSYAGYLRNNDAGVGTGLLSVVMSGTGTQTLTGPHISYTGGTTVNGNGGTLSLLGIALPSTGAVSIASGSTLQYNNSGGVTQGGATTFTGAGKLQKMGAGNLVFGSAGVVTVNLSSGAIIDVEAGTLVGSSSNQANWAGNSASLNIALSAIFNTVEAGGSSSPFPTFNIDALTGSGTFQGGYAPQGVSTAHIGVANGSGAFSGVIQDNTGVGTLALNKMGSGTETLSGANTYTGATTISAGTLKLAQGSSFTGTAISVATRADSGPATDHRQFDCKHRRWRHALAGPRRQFQYVGRLQRGHVGSGRR